MLIKKRMLVPLMSDAERARRPVPKRSLSDFLLQKIGAVIGTIYSFTFSWLDRRVARQNQRQFEEDIRTNLAFLFNEYGAKVVPNEGVRFPPGFDGAFVTLGLGVVLLRFSRGRGDFDVKVSSVFAAGRWEDFRLIAEGVSEWNLSATPKDHQYSLESFGPLLRKHLPDLEQSMSEANVETTMDRAVELHNKAVDEYAARLTASGFTPKFY
jgi:hypothetical protein